MVTVRITLPKRDAYPLHRANIIPSASTYALLILGKVPQSAHGNAPAVSLEHPAKTTAMAFY